VKAWFVLGMCFMTALWAEKNELKHSLHANMVHLYDSEPVNVESIEKIFSEGVFYGRLRSNSFGFVWGEELEANGKPVRKDHAATAIGGSLIYRSAYFHGFGFGAGAYASWSYGTLGREESYLYKAGKDTFSRYDRLTDGDTGMVVLAEAYMEYKKSRTHLKIGRQLFESFLTKSNDTKMIPNAFEGVTVTSRDVPETLIKAAYFTRQKLRDHTDFHHLFAYAYDANEPYYYTYTENDDSAMHRGLTLAKLQAAGIDDRLVVLEAKNWSVENLTLTANYTAVPDLLSSVMIQADYIYHMQKWALIPSFRYMYQFDNGAGEIGGASRKGVVLSGDYDDPTDLNSWLVGVRLDAVKENLKVRVAYTQVADKGDIIAPWRGFPTGGFTRAMGQYNWDANTKTYMVQVDYTPQYFDNVRVVARVALQDFDDNKAAPQADSNLFTIDMMRGFHGISNFYAKLRYAHVVGEDDTVTPSGFRKPDPSYDEVRLEFNYLF